MIKILADASLSNLHRYFDDRFQITFYKSSEDLHHRLSDEEILLCRSTLAVNATLLENTTIRIVATASSGTDHIDSSFLHAHEIAVCDAKGANSRAVTDYVMACIAYLNSTVNIGQYVGVVGCGAVGSAVMKRLQSLGLDVIGYDPLRAMEDRHFQTCDQTELFDCDLLCIHANLHDEAPYPSRHLIDANFLSHLKPQTIIINAARGDIINEQALLAHQNKMVYCTDVYHNEPKILSDVIDYATICTPHIAGHSMEARATALQILSQKIHVLLGLSYYEKAENLLQIPQKKIGLTWQDNILSLYNPNLETQILKQSIDKTATFLQLRKAHQFRHDFHCYHFSSAPKLLQQALDVRIEYL